MAEVSFTVSARTARLIGQENFANADGAIVELVKNCYDADGNNAIIVFDNTNENPQEHSIYIIDNGIGMNDSTIISYWMMIGTNNKENVYESDLGRIKTGAKGIGRFALDRLGEIAEIYTLPKEELQGYLWKVNWEDFKIPNIGISQVTASLDPISNFNYRHKVEEIATNSERLLTYLSSIDFNNGTLIKISKLRDVWQYEDLKRLNNNLEILIPPKEQNDFKIALFIKSHVEEFGEVQSANYDDYDYKLSAIYTSENKTVSITIQRNEFDLKRIEEQFSDVFEMPSMKSERFNWQSFLNESISYEISINELIKGYTEKDEDNLLEKIGDFSFTFYYLKNTRSDDKNDSSGDKYPYKNFNSATRRNWLKRFGGVKIFRDGFRVRPYGEYGQDWLRLGERQAQSPQGAGQRMGAFRIRPNQISGTINISRISNINFQDKSGREGLQENDVFDLFKEIIVGIINQFERDRNTIMYSFSERYKIVKKEEEDKKAAEELAKQILEGQGNSDQQTPKTLNNTNQQPVSINPSDAEIVLAKGVQAKDNEIREKDEEIRLLRGLSGTGLIVASVAHELRSIRTLLVNRTDDLKNVLKRLISSEIIKALPEEENPFLMLNDMREQDIQIKHWLDYSLSALQRDKRTRTNLYIEDYFETYKANWENVCKRRQVKLNIYNKLKTTVAIRAFIIDFDTIFNNLLINSFDSFKRRKDGQNRIVNIYLTNNENDLQIIFEDNGAGLSKDYYSNPNQIFEPFESSKVDRKGNKIGTGMGMYLVKTIVEDYKGSIEVVEYKNCFIIELTFPLRK